MKASVWPIVRDHFATMRDARTGKLSQGDLLFFYGLPIAAAAADLLLGWPVKGVANLLAALSIMTGLLFNLLVLLFDTAVRAKDGTRVNNRDLEIETRYKLIHELQANVTYTLGTGLLAAILLGYFSLAGVEDVRRPWSVLVIVLLAHFVLLLGMLLKRIRSVFLSEFPPQARTR